MTDRPRSRFLPGLAVLGCLAVAGLLAPLLANDKPILVVGDGRIACPAAVDLPVLGTLLARSGGGWPPQSLIIHAPIPYSYRGVRLEEALQGPSGRHWMGTDALGRDIFARLVHGASVSLLVGAGATLISLVLGSLLGGLAGIRGGLADLVLSRFIETLGCFPSFLLALALVAVSGGAGLRSVVVAVGLGRTASAARFVRSEVLRFRGGVAWSAARSTGASPARIALRHVLPAMAAPLLVQAVFGMGQAILLESGLSFLGVGVQPPTPSWGMLLAESRVSLETAWWPVLFPSLALALSLGSLAWAADRASDLLD